MSEKTCGTCRFRGEAIKHWDWDATPVSEVATGYFLCALIKHNTYPGKADRDHSINGPAYVVDGSGYHAALCVADDFGCNRWENSQ